MKTEKKRNQEISENRYEKNSIFNPSRNWKERRWNERRMKERKSIGNESDMIQKGGA